MQSITLFQMQHVNVCTIDANLPTYHPLERGAVACQLKKNASTLLAISFSPHQDVLAVALNKNQFIYNHVIMPLFDQAFNGS